MTMAAVLLLEVGGHNSDGEDDSAEAEGPVEANSARLNRILDQLGVKEACQDPVVGTQHQVLPVVLPEPEKAPEVN